MSEASAACKISRRPRRAVEIASIGVFLVSVGAVARHTHSLGAIGDTNAYHESVRAAVAAAPREFGDWVGLDVPVPAQAQTLLRPTAVLSRQYVSRTTGEACIVTIVHCGDARNMLDHFPPNCYPGQGWTLQSSAPDDLPLSVGTVHATDYLFSRGEFGASTAASVTNAMLLPNGTSDRDMTGVERAMGTPTLRFYGVAQVQVFCDQAIAAERRREIAAEMLEGHRACITTITRAGTLR